MKAAIRFIPHNEIDKVRWDDTVLHSTNSLIYANTFFLDAMSPGWHALVLGNYEAVFPITWRSKMGIQYVCQPAFTQQLGLFSPDKNALDLLPQFLIKLATRYRLIEIQLNHSNTAFGKADRRSNYVLPLDPSYEWLRAGYKTDLQKNLKRNAKFHMQYDEGLDAKDAIALYKSQYGAKMAFREKDFELFEGLMARLLSMKYAFVRRVFMPGWELMAAGVFCHWNGRIYNLASTTLPNGRMMEANHFLFDCLIREFCQKAEVLDFEGSDLPGIARFYQKFGSLEEPYHFWKSNRLPAILRWWKR
jgi:hypothetical protein